jgi:hypothetical protein
MGNDNITDPFIGLSVMPAVSSLFRDMTGIRFEHPGMGSGIIVPPVATVTPFVRIPLFLVGK